jgi:hypothetical protein
MALARRSIGALVDQLNEALAPEPGHEHSLPAPWRIAAGVM